MLRRLTIRDFVIVDHLELDFQAGFGALTGETGAGKSILLDALGLALGDRADAGAVRGGRERAEVCAEFDLPADGALAAWLAEQALDAEEGSVMLRRVVDAGGRSRAWLNGTPVTLAQLREAGEFLCDIHGQHAHHALLRADAQRALLDTHAGAVELAAAVAAAHRAWRQALERRQHAERDSAATERERELLAWQVRELEELAFDPDEWAELNQEHGRLAHAASLMGGADEVLAALGDNDLAVAPLLARLGARVGEMAGIDGSLDETRSLLADAAIQADEALHALRRYRDRLDLDPERLTEIEARIGAVTDLARKHRAAPEELPALLDDCRARLEALSASADPGRLAEQEAQARAAFEDAARRLSAARKPAAEALSAEVTAAIQTLAMAGGRFEIALEPLPEGCAHGLENVEFRVAANASQPPRALARVASGGELSRIGLAIQVTASRDSATPTMIFDEVDVGIGGGVAEIVGQLLHRLGRERQVLCVTHLAQVAARADWQWSIAKAERNGEVLSRVAVLDEGGRVEEIARMLGGVRITDTTRQHAAEMLGQG
ncbi:DNA repair protein RecN [Pseudothauera nasutitermitis]|uniref:DNA repair protein RecN n=1 Tax=Pseudothauera nasutitermitis TaxID=2565930 RepID=A0A4S4B798_9RHOO|nr:DNA repair protein RecN [Pseudothauera nasutitermitis]THF66883.1 DNA repair protein RecN [Pseudothauera nasutitermitis]